MKNKLFTLILLLATTVSTMFASVKIGDLYYNLNVYNHTAEVTSNPDKYSGIIIVPESVVYDSASYTVTGIGWCAFLDSKRLVSISLPNTITDIKEWAFHSCAGLTGEFKIPQGVIQIGRQAFYGCAGLTGELIIPNSVSDIKEGAFYGCAGLSNVIFGTGVSHIGNEAFYGCTGLSDELVIPNNITSIDPSAFSNCSGLTSVSLPNSITDIRNNTFNGCSNLRNVTLGDNITSIGEGAFRGCFNLEPVTFPVQLTTIQKDAFRHCISWDEMVIPATLLTFEEDAMPYVPEVTFEGLVPPSVDKCFFGVAYVPESALETYRAAWPERKNQILVKNPSENNREISVSALPNMSAIHVALGDADLGKIVSLKVSGTINAYDLMVLNNKMVALQHLDLMDADILSTADGYEYYTGYTTKDSVLAPFSFQRGNVALVSLKLPHSLKRIESKACINLSSLRHVDFGENITSIGDSAFFDCLQLQEIRIGDSVKAVGKYAFVHCYSVRSIYIGKNVESIGEYAFALLASYPWTAAHEGILPMKKIEWNVKKNPFFSNGWNHSLALRPENGGLNAYFVVLDSLVLGDDVEEIPENFLNIQPHRGIKEIKTIVVGKNICSFGANAFYCDDEPNKEYYFYMGINKVLFNGNTGDWLKIRFANAHSNPIYLAHNLYIADTLLTSLNVADTIEQVNPYAFDGCETLKRVRFSSKLKSIGDYSFRNCANLEEVRLPSSLLSIGESAFEGSNKIQNVYTYTVEPISINQHTFSCWTTAMLNVPHTSRFIYWYNTQWSQFINSQDFDEPYDYFYANGDVELGGETGTIEGDPDADFNPGSGLIVEGDDTQGLDSINLYGNDDNTASIISCDNLKANSIVIRLAVKANSWYFFCFPWDILVDHLELRGRIAIREYDGAERAENGLGGWKDLNGNKLHKGRGYIMNAEFNDTITIRILHPTFDCNNAETALFTFDSENRFDAGWNLIGNPFTSYFDLDMLFQLGFTMPIITWNGTGYDTYRPGDDEYHFSPFEAFFVQAANLLSLIFDSDGRETYIQSQEASANPAPRRAKAMDDNRRIINLTLGNDDYRDRTRVVFNPASSMEYEDGVDAAKFMSSTADVQLYTLDIKNQPYAINERPSATSDIALGYKVSKAGEYTLSAPRMDAKVKIYDNELGVEVDLSQGDYTFYTEAGTNNTRFGIRRTPEVVTSIEELMNDESNGPVNIYTIPGALLHKNVMLRDVQLMSGVYIVEGQQEVNKVVVE